MNKFIRKEEVSNKLEYKKKITCAVILAILPLMSAVIICALQKKTIFQISLLTSELNDELLYFKQVEGIINFGYPRGYFGYNESHALKASFGFWSPISMLPWVIWGLLFGWNLLSPIYCNLVLMMFAMFIFGWMVYPNIKQMLILGCLYLTCIPLTRYVLSAMQDSICISLVIITISLVFSYQKEKGLGKLVLLFIVTCIMSLMRPYMILFMTYPIYEWIREKKWVGVIGSLLIVSTVLSVYFLISYFFSAKYFFPSFDTEWISAFFQNGIANGIIVLKDKLLYVGKLYFSYFAEGIKREGEVGKLIVAFSIAILVLIAYLIGCIKKRSKRTILYIFFLICSLGAWVAICLLYNLEPGSRHLLIYVVMVFFSICMMDNAYIKYGIIMLLTFLFLFILTPKEDYSYHFSFLDDKTSEQANYWEDVFETEIALSTNNVPSFENSMLWVYNDKLGEEWQKTPYQMLYKLPKGMGISCCTQNYVIKNINVLKCKYLAVIPNGQIDELCNNMGMREIARREEMVIYEVY